MSTTLHLCRSCRPKPQLFVPQTFSVVVLRNSGAGAGSSTEHCATWRPPDLAILQYRDGALPFGDTSNRLGLIEHGSLFHESELKIPYTHFFVVVVE